MKALVLYYTRTGVTRKAAEIVAKILECDIEEIKDKKNRMGAINWMICGKDAMKKNLTEIEETKFDPSGYDLIVFGTPVWAGNITPAIRTYINNNSTKIKKYAFFSTQGNNKEVEIQDLKYKRIIGTKDFKSTWISTKEVNNGEFKKLNDFCKELAKQD